jgi:hypothetical protein
MADNRGAKRRIKLFPLVFSHELGKDMGTSSNFSETGIFKTRKCLEPDSPIKIILKTESKTGVRLFFHSFIGKNKHNER